MTTRSILTHYFGKSLDASWLEEDRALIEQARSSAAGRYYLFEVVTERWLCAADRGQLENAGEAARILARDTARKWHRLAWYLGGCALANQLRQRIRRNEILLLHHWLGPETCLQLMRQRFPVNARWPGELTADWQSEEQHPCLRAGLPVLLMALGQMDGLAPRLARFLFPRDLTTLPAEYIQVDDTTWLADQLHSTEGGLADTPREAP